MTDPFAPFKEKAWRDIAAIDARLAQGEIDEEQWHLEMAAVVVPAYLAAETPWEQSGKSGAAESWEYARSLVADAIDRDGSFLDVGCANGYLMECLPRWTSFKVEPFGLEIAPELAALARQRSTPVDQPDLGRQRRELVSAASLHLRSYRPRVCAVLATVCPCHAPVAVLPEAHRRRLQ